MTADTPAPAPGQVWADYGPHEDCRRTIRIDRIRDIPHVRPGRTDRYAECTVLTTCSGQPPVGRAKTRIRLDRFRPTANGYRYLRTDPVQDGDQP